MRTIHHWINGGPKDVGRPLAVLDPATGSQIAEVTLADTQFVNEVVASAVAAQPRWAELPVSRRSRVLARYADLLRERANELAALITAEHGKTLDDARGEVARGIEAVETAVAGLVSLKGELMVQTGTNIDTSMTLEPVGVCVGITPFNFPTMVPLMQGAFALAAGNSYILKPSEQDPGAALRLAEIAQEAGIPDGVFSVVHGDRKTVEALLAHPEVAAVAFVGSTPVAKSIYEQAAHHGKRVQALGGAKNHLVVMPDANLEAAAAALVSAAFGSAGQRCMAITTAVAVGDVADRLVDRLREHAEAVTVAAGTTPGAEMGPVISRAAQDRIRGLVQEAIAAGATPVVDRSHERPAGSGDGFFVGPTVLDHLAPEMEIYRTEVFGPVLGVIRVETLEDAVALIGNNPYGNGSSIFTSSGLAARTFQRRVTTGMVGVNIPIPVPVANFGFSGWKDSAFGDTGLNSSGWRFYTRTKFVTSRWDTTVAELDLGFRPN